MRKMRDFKSSYEKVERILEERGVEEYDIFNIIFLTDEINYYYRDLETGEVDCITIIQDNVTNTKLEDFK